MSQAGVVSVSLATAETSAGLPEPSFIAMNCDECFMPGSFHSIVRDGSGHSLQWYCFGKCSKQWIVCADPKCKESKQPPKCLFLLDSNNKSSKRKLSHHMNKYHSSFELPVDDLTTPTLCERSSTSASASASLPVFACPLPGIGTINDANDSSKKRRILISGDDDASDEETDLDSNNSDDSSIPVFERDDKDEDKNDDTSSLSDGDMDAAIDDAMTIVRKRDLPRTAKSPAKFDSRGLDVFARKESKDYFTNQRNNGWPFVHLVMRVLYKTEQPMNIEFSKEDAAKFFVFANTVWQMPTKAQKHFACVVHMFQSFNDQTFVPFLPCPVKNHQDLMKLMYSGKHSFFKRVPHPVVQEIDGDQCVYISVIESLAHFLHHDNPPDYEAIEEHAVTEVDSPTKSKFAQSKLDKTVDYHFLANSWQDGFQANYSTKTNRLKPWIKTMTIVGRVNPHNPSGHSLPSVFQTTFPVAFGIDQKPNSQAEEMFYEEMGALDRPGGMEFYHGKLRKTVKVRVSLGIVRGDQPERRKMTGTIGINGDEGPAFAMIGNVKQVWRNISSCDNCLKALVEDERIVENCQSCLNWSYF